MYNGIRNFYMKNDKGVEYDMTRPEALLYNVSGIGWGINPDVEELGSTWLVRDRNEIQPKVSGTIEFPTFDEYYNFVHYCQSGKNKLCYMPGFKNDTKTYFLECEVEISKASRSRGKWIQATVTFIGASYWYDVVKAKTFEEEGEEDGKKYAHTYSYTYGSGDSNVLEFDMHLGSYFKLTIMGPCNNPTYSLMQNGEIVKSGKINVSISSTQKLVINTNPTALEIALYQKSTDKLINNVYDKSDFTTERIFAIPAGKSKIIMSCADAVSPTAYMEVYARV